MAPTLAAGDLLLVRRVDSPLASTDAGTEPAPGDLVIVKWPDQPLAVKRLLHREADGTWWVERDADRGIDSWSHGAVPAQGLRAVVLRRLWPRQPLGAGPCV